MSEQVGISMMRQPIMLSKASFMLSAALPKQFPDDAGCEVAFVGRSNAGKSSALNAITGQKQLARTSKTPGRTQLVNFFQCASQQRLVDLPGYGFAKAPQAEKAKWDRLVEAYLSHRACLQAVVLLMDIRHPLKEIDKTIIDWATQSQLQLHILLTKADKLKFGRAKQTLLAVSQAINWLESDKIVVQLFSANSQQGLDELQAAIAKYLQLDV